MTGARVTFGSKVVNVNEALQNGQEHSFTRVVGLEHIEPGNPVLSQWDELSDLVDGTSFRRVFRRGQLLFGKRRAYQRKVAVAPFDGICSSDILVFEPRDKSLMPEYLSYVVQSDRFFAHALNTSSGSLSPRTRWEDLASFEFELPSLDEQARIVELLSAVDTHLLNLDRLIHSGEALFRALSTATDETAGQVESKSLGEVADFINGFPFKPNDLGDEGVPVIRIRQLLDELSECDRTERSVPDKCVLRDGDIVFSWSGTLAVVIWSRGHALLNQHLFRVIPVEGIDREWLYFALCGAIEDLDKLTHGTTMKHITKKELLPFMINVPTLKGQREIADKANKLRAAQHALARTRTSTLLLRSTLLNKEVS